MERRRLARVVGGITALATATLGLGIAGTAGAASDPADQFKNLKPIKAPSPCKNDPGVTDDGIKIGSIIPSSGAFATFAAIQDGVKARFAKANAENELDGRQLTLVNVDDGGDAARNVTAAQQLVEDEDVFAIITESAAGDASGKYLSEQKVPVVGWQLGLPVWGTYTNYFGFQNANTKDIKTHYTSRPADAIKALGAKKVAVIGISTAAGAVFAEQIADSVDKTKGLKMVYKTTDIPAGSTEFGAVVDQIKQSGADTVYTTLGFAEASQLMNQMKQAGVKPKITVFPAAYDPRVLGIEALDGVYMSIEYKPFEITPEWPGLTEFKKWLPQTAPNASLGQLTAVGWLSAEALIEGIKAAGVSCPTRKAFINNLRLEKGYTADGWFPPMNFADVFNKPFPCAYYVQVVNKQFVPQFDGKQLCAKQEITNNKIKQIVPDTTTTTAPTTTAPAS
jgi:ABC-type branched-subunit amino acid transport system substrate-binding protein